MQHRQTFESIHNDFLQKKIIANMPLSIALLENNKQNPWIILVPKISNAVEIIDLSTAQQHALLNEINIFSKILKQQFNADKLNIAALGNVTPQLHIHVIARYKDSNKDQHFPKPLFGLEATKMNDFEQQQRIEIMNNELIKIGFNQ